MKSIQVEVKNVLATVSEAEIKALDAEVAAATSKLYDGNGEGNDFLGWLRLPSETSDSLIEEISSTAAQLRSLCDYVVCIGIGGSYLGAKAVIEALSDSFATLKQHNGPQVLFAGQNIGEDYLYELQSLLSDKKFGIIVISKSGTTTEPAIAFRIVKEYIEKHYKDASERIVAVTDARKGALKTLSTQEGYRTFVVPDNVGGRFSVLTPVGLIPILLAGFDVRAMLKGAEEMEKSLAERSENNPAVVYAAMRNLLYSEYGKKIEILVTYNPKFQYLGEWWKQLYGESEGKDGKGIFPASVNNTADLHSMGQFIQEGERVMFETVVNIEKSNRNVVIGTDEQNLDQLNYLAGQHVEHCGAMAQLGTKLAHIDGGVPQMEVSIEKIDAFNLGGLFYFFEFACGVSAYTLGVNPFNQPGVEAYKKNMFALLGKPGYEELGAALRERL